MEDKYLAFIVGIGITLAVFGVIMLIRQVLGGRSGNMTFSTDGDINIQAKNDTHITEVNGEVREMTPREKKAFDDTMANFNKIMTDMFKDRV